jgi:membrane protease YdiL (CAAX protease family)
MLRPHYPKPLHGLLLVLSATLISIFGVSMQMDPNEPNVMPDIGGVGVAFTIGFGLVGTLAAQRVPAPRPERLGLRGFDPAFVGVIIALLPFIMLTSEIDNWLALWFPMPEPEKVRELLDAALANQTALSIAQMAIYRIGLEPVVSEWLLRGVVLQGAIAYMGRTSGVLFTAIVGMGQLGLMQGTSVPSAMLLPIAGGIVLCLVRISSGSLLAPILLHMGWNAIVVGGMAAYDVMPIPGLTTPDTFTPWVLLLVSVASVGLAYTGVMRGLSEQPVVLEIEEEPDPEEREDDEGGGFF